MQSEAEGDRRALRSAPTPSGERFSGSILTQWGLTTNDAIALLLMMGFVVAFVPPLLFSSWTPRMVLLWVALPLGMWTIAVSAMARDRAALAAIALLGWASLSALMSGAVRSSFVGTVGRELSVLILVGGLACWAIGRGTSERFRLLLPVVLLGCLTANAAVGVLQVLVGVERGSLALAAGRPTGFSVNPVYFGALAASGLVCGCVMWCQESRRWVFGAIVVCGLATSLSGSRVAFASGVLVLAAFTANRRTRRSFLVASVGLASLAAGVGIDRLVGSGRNAADRLVDASDGSGGRSEVWRYGVEAWLDRPLLGFGFGRFRPAVQSRFSTEFVRDHATNELTQAWFDAHNVLINTLVGIGIVGVVLMAVWFWCAASRPSSPVLVWALVPIGMSWMLQPVSLATMPLALLILGAAGPVGTNDPSTVVGRRFGLLVGVGVLAGGWLLVADVNLKFAADDSSASRTARAASWFLVDDPVVADVAAQVHSFDPNSTLEDELKWRRRAAQAEPDRPYWWTKLADAQMRAGDLDAAGYSLERMALLQPNSIQLVRVELFLAYSLGDEQRLENSIVRACGFALPECELDAQELLSDAVVRVVDG